MDSAYPGTVASVAESFTPAAKARPCCPQAQLAPTEDQLVQGQGWVAWQVAYGR